MIVKKAKTGSKFGFHENLPSFISSAEKITRAEKITAVLLSVMFFTNIYAAIIPIIHIEATPRPKPTGSNFEIKINGEIR